MVSGSCWDGIRVCNLSGVSGVYFLLRYYRAGNRLGEGKRLEAIGIGILRRDIRRDAS